MSNELLIFAITVFTGFFAVMNPLVSLPAFLDLVEGADKDQIKKIARLGTITAFLIIVFFIFFGNYIFHLFGITIPAFKVTGGILLFLVGFDMLQSKPPKVNSTSQKVTLNDSIAISPLAIPLLAGPGTIVTAMNYTEGVNMLHLGIITAAFALVIFLTYLTFISSDFIIKKLGNNMIDVIGKLMGFLLAIMGTGMLIEGVKLAFTLK
jgi:multiple antibiotic resistance protein